MAISKSSLLLGLVPALVLSAVCYWFIPQFAEVYRGFGAPLPWQSELLLHLYPGVVILPVIVLAAWFFWPNTPARDAFVILVGAGGSVVLFVFGVWAAYSPIFLLGTVA